MKPNGCHALSEHYRLPDSFLRLQVQPGKEWSRGFFSFGENVVCYGHSSCGGVAPHLNGHMPDAWTEVKANGNAAILPFDPDEILDNLRSERYVAATHAQDWRSGFVRAGRSLYYGLRPTMPFVLRAYVKKAYLAGWQKTRFPRWPVDVTVDLLLENLLAVLLKTQAAKEVPFIWFWPDGYESCSVMTHDVETAAGRDFIDTIMELDESAGIKASFQIVPEERYANSDVLVRHIKGRGFEVNVHDLNHDGRLFDDRREFLRRAKKINHYLRQYGAAGYRTGVMYRNQDWYGAFQCEYDMSVSNVAHLDPQHGGCCTVMPYFIGNIVELPLTTIQDYFLFYTLKDYSFDTWKRQVEIIRQQHGLISFIVHPDYVIVKRNLATFKALLEYLVDLRTKANIWFASPGDVNRWWRQRRRMRMIRHESGWRIDGDGCERARIAFAYLRDGKIAYDICPSRLASDRSERDVLISSGNPIDAPA